MDTFEFLKTQNLPDKKFLKYHIQLVRCQNIYFGLVVPLSPNQALKTKSIGHEHLSELKPKNAKITLMEVSTTTKRTLAYKLSENQKYFLVFHSVLG